MAHAIRRFVYVLEQRGVDNRHWDAIVTAPKEGRDYLLRERAYMIATGSPPRCLRVVRYFSRPSPVGAKPRKKETI